MNCVPKMSRLSLGFTLVEMAIVLLIVALLLGGLLPTVSSQIEQQHRNETRKQIEEIRQALMGYAIINGTLPCPTTMADPADPKYGSADITCNTDVAIEGFLPWKTLGVPETDAWGSKRTGVTDPWTGYWRYRVDRNFVFTGTFTTDKLVTGFFDKMKIVDSNNNLLSQSPANCNNTSPSSECPVAVVYSTGPNVKADGQNATYEPNSAVNPTYQNDAPNPNFDDILIWISRPQLFNRMVSAGKLP